MAGAIFCAPYCFDIAPREMFGPPRNFCELFAFFRQGRRVAAHGGDQMTLAVGERETSSLIGSDKVEGTDVYGPDESKVGEIERVMIDKITGKVAYAVMSFGGFLGIGEDYYPVPWPMLKYDTNLGGYRTGITKDTLERAPKYRSENEWNWNRDNDARVYEHYKAQPYWA